MTHYHIFKTACGWCGVIRTRRGIVRSCLPEAEREAVRKAIHRFAPDARPSARGMARIRRALCAYFDGKRVALDFPLDLSGVSPFRQKVLRAAAAIPHGEVRTYGQLAKEAGNPRASRAVGGAMANNPVAPFVPCHRVVAANGQLGGFSAKEGVKLKARLLEHEGHTVQKAGDSFRLLC